jgi:hypothetical protein
VRVTSRLRWVRVRLDLIELLPGYRSASHSVRINTPKFNTQREQAKNGHFAAKTLMTQRTGMVIQRIRERRLDAYLAHHVGAGGAGRPRAKARSAYPVPGDRSGLGAVPPLHGLHRICISLSRAIHLILPLRVAVFVPGCDHARDGNGSECHGGQTFSFASEEAGAISEGFGDYWAVTVADVVSRRLGVPEREPLVHGHEVTWWAGPCPAPAPRCCCACGTLS